MIRITTILIYTFVTLLGCIDKTNNSKKPTRNTCSNWMNVDYLNCLKTDLPCECEKSQEFFLISIDTSNQFVALYEGRANYEHGYNNYRVISNTNLEVYEMHYSQTLLKDSIAIIGQISIKEDSLFFRETSGKLTKFILYNSDERDGYFKEHVKLLNRALETRGYDNLSTLLLSDSLKCWCNWELGGANIVFRAEKKWILERKENELYIYEWTNPPRVKTLDLKIEKKS